MKPLQPWRWPWRTLTPVDCFRSVALVFQVLKLSSKPWSLCCPRMWCYKSFTLYSKSLVSALVSDVQSLAVTLEVVPVAVPLHLW